MRIALAQLDPTVGDVAGNERLVLEAIERARRDRADLLCTGELALIGYPPRDLLFRGGVVEACERAVARIAAAAGEVTVIVGHPRRCREGRRPFANSVSVCSGGRVAAVYDKRLLPGYDVFDEDRYFNPGDRVCVIDLAGRRVGVLICEDLWQAGDVLAQRSYGIDPVRESAAAGASLLVVPNASPFIVGKWQKHLDQLRSIARTHRLPIATVHQVGANDDLIFDGRSVAVEADGSVAGLLPGFEPAVATVELPARRPVPIDVPADFAAPMKELFHALVLGVRDYVRKTGNDKVAIGLSGGIDSALVACIAAAALGPEGVIGVMMPSRYSAEISRADAEELAENLGLRHTHVVPIESVHGGVRSALASTLGPGLEGVTDENIQARVRGLYLMGLANARGALVLATGNKSELAAGYCTIYGDMCGALSVLGDVVKTRVYDLARWVNDHPASCGFARPPIPPRSLTRPPSAELRPGQTDQDTLPPYRDLDVIVERHVEREQSVGQIVEETEFDAPFVQRVVRLIDRAQFKREQAAPILKVTPRTFGRGRPMPIAMRYSEPAAGPREEPPREAAHREPAAPHEVVRRDAAAPHDAPRREPAPPREPPRALR